MNKQDIEILRTAIRQSLPDIEPTRNDTELVMKGTYVPTSYLKALNEDYSLIVGMRGAGKTFWTTALASNDHRRFIQKAYPDIKIQNAIVSVGFNSSKSETFPENAIISNLVKHLDIDDCAVVWRTILACQTGILHGLPQDCTWKDRCDWVRNNPENVARHFRLYDTELRSKKQFHYILFDELDRLTNTWASIRPLIKSLFQIALEFQAYYAIRLKLFVRPDIIEDTEITAFSDASKLLAKKTMLEWNMTDLYALLFQSLINASVGGNLFRDMINQIIVPNTDWNTEENIYLIPYDLRNNEELQQKVFEKIAGRYMTKASPSAHKRGYVYKWLPNHLMDGREAVSPRSFCAAVREAAAYDRNLSEWQYPLHYKGIMTGVQAASLIRVDEVYEDYPWIKKAMGACGGITVPADKETFIGAWEKSKIIPTIQAEQNMRLSPLNIVHGEEGLLDDLERVGILSRIGKERNRIQIPDVYRIAFGMGRKGGVQRL